MNVEVIHVEEKIRKRISNVRPGWKTGKQANFC